MASGLTSSIQHRGLQAENLGVRAEQAAERAIKSIVPSEQEHIVDESVAVLKRYLNMPFSFSLESDIHKARNICKNLKDFPAYVDGGLVSSQIKQADAVCFLTMARAGIFMTGHFGTGCVLKRLKDGTWSAPSAVGYIGTGFGLQGGADLTDYVIILKRQAVDSFTSTSQLVLGGDVGASFWIGRHGTAELHMGKRTGVSLGWAASKGFFAGAAATAGIIRTRRGSNQKFYGRQVDPVDLFSDGYVKPRAAKPLYDALKDLP